MHEGGQPPDRDACVDTSILDKAGLIATYALVNGSRTPFEIDAEGCVRVREGRVVNFEHRKQHSLDCAIAFEPGAWMRI